jgi:hypothetical protein
LSCVCYFGGALGPAATPADALEVITIIKSFGFSVSEPKTNLLMLMVMDLLGFTLDTNFGVMEFRVPERRASKLESTARALLEEMVVGGGQAQARSLARLAGQVMSMQTALGLVCRVRSRYLLHCLRPAAVANRYGMLVDVFRGRGLHKDAMDGRISIEFGNELEQVLL